MRARLLVLLIPALAASVQAGEPATSAADEIRRLMAAAIDSPHGEARGTLSGEIADAVTRRFHATSPIHVLVTTERRYRQAGCSRLKVTLRQEDVLLPGAAAARLQTFEFGVDYCRDGTAPRSPL